MTFVRAYVSERCVHACVYVCRNSAGVKDLHRLEVEGELVFHIFAEEHEHLNEGRKHRVIRTR